MADKMMRVASRGVDGLSKPLQADTVGKLKVNNSNSAVVAKHIAQPVANRYMGADGSITTDLATVKPADFTNFRGRAIHVVNKTTAIIGSVKVFGFIDKNDPTTAIEIGNTGNVPAGTSKLFNMDNNGFENINYGIYEGIAIQATYGAAGTGSASFYLLGESQPTQPKVTKVSQTGRQTIQAINDIDRKTTREIVLNVPENAKGTIVSLRVTALNGLDPSLMLYTSIGASGIRYAQLNSPLSLKTAGTVTHIWNPNASLGDANIVGNVVISEMSPQTQLTLNTVIEGIGSGTGITYTCDVTWLL